MTVAEPTCLQRLLEIITAIFMLIGGMSAASTTPVQPALSTTEYVLSPAVSDYTDSQLHEAAEKILRRMELLGIEGVQVEITNTALIVMLPNSGDPTDAVAAMTRQGLVEFVDRDGTGEAVVTTDDIVSAIVEFSDYGAWVVNLTLSEVGGEAMSQFSRENIGQVMSIVIDGVTISEPIVQSEISAEIALQGNFTEQEALALAVQIGGGALPFPMTLESVGASE